MKLKIMTFNIRYDIHHDGPNCWEFRRERVLELVRRQKADIVGFQEALPHQREQLEEGLPQYQMVGQGRDRNGGGEECTLAFTRDFLIEDSGTFWLSPTPEVPGSLGWDAMLTRICTWARVRYQGQTLSVFNAHFDHHGRVAPIKSAEMILARLSRLGHPHLLMGDFNSRPDSQAVSLLTTKLRDSFEIAHPGDTTGTYHEYGRVEPYRIDYLMMSPHWDIQNCQILAQGGEPYTSDHFPVVGEYRLPSVGLALNGSDGGSVDS